jgi:glucosamine 6-phosphate synthetase-like amidotransferase/phosphosugar isomerase protein
MSDAAGRAIDVMRDELDTIPGVIADQAERLGGPLAALVASVGGESLPELVLTGCGDSYFAGVAVTLAMERDAGIRCRALEALELARYGVRYVPVSPTGPPLLIAISYSGEVGRTIEAATAAGRFGWHVAALTGRADGRLARSTSNPVLMDVPTLGFSPGTSTYIAMITASLVLARELARARGRLDGVERIERALGEAPSLARETLALAAEPAAAVAELMSRSPVTTFLGAGPHRASAEFGAAKLFEGPQRYGVAQQLEEWAHEQYFVSGPTTPVIVVAPAGASHDRAGELLAEMAFIGVPSILVTDEPDDAIARSATHVLPIARGIDEAYSPLLTCLPLALAAYYLAERLGSRSYGFPSPEHEREHYDTIHRATMGEPA